MRTFGYYQSERNLYEQFRDLWIESVKSVTLTISLKEFAIRTSDITELQMNSMK